MGLLLAAHHTGTRRALSPPAITNPLAALHRQAAAEDVFYQVRWAHRRTHKTCSSDKKDLCVFNKRVIQWPAVVFAICCWLFLVKLPVDLYRRMMAVTSLTASWSPFQSFSAGISAGGRFSLFLLLFLFCFGDFCHMSPYLVETSAVLCIHKSFSVNCRDVWSQQTGSSGSYLTFRSHQGCRDDACVLGNTHNHLCQDLPINHTSYHHHPHVIYNFKL